ncbi:MULTISPECIES: hypothetical protein [Kitasatospora]|uniref:hypothetical protein n=1 Tax=Kitasatospora TaxID=2063 RepID=UPI0004C35DE4|nr:hypothetical protein [Kitasatospora sp. NRRL B-11411]
MIQVKALLVLVALLLSLLAAVAAALLSRSTGKPTASALLVGGGAFATAVPLCLLVFDALGLL